MKILVCISHVPDTTSKINFSADQKEFSSAGIQFVINPYDEIALTRALELSEASAGTVTVINVGDATTEATLRKALAIGATDAVRIDAAPRDAYFTAVQIANYAKDQSFDLILTGRESIDYNGAQLCGMLGELLSMPSVSVCKKLDLNGNDATLEREIEGGKEILTCSLPMCISASEGMAEPRIPNMRGIMGARSKPLNVVAAVAADELSKVQSYDKPKPRGQVKLIEAEKATELIDLLHNEAKVI
ncbi:MAG TPA: electron transfer flavoprotein subunit beta/FixA family protein [Bacteroidia bacterium]|nr:electron transfer flavoprotein subunit beta/FixA family protein [Bacteroidia bacterium]HNT79832.1 electron transfer flavoprotein subunit beta/FixA family protein [Bacteroidia bacterium]